MTASRLIHLLNEAIQAEGKDLDVWVWEYDQDNTGKPPSDLTVFTRVVAGDEKIIIIEG